MSGNITQNPDHQGGGNNLSDETIRKFLLGRLSSAEQSTFEAQLLTDDELEARVRLAEFDLSDDYAFDRLRVNERDRFEEWFLIGSERKLKLGVSKALFDRFAFDRAPARTSRLLLEKLGLPFRFDRRFERFAFASLILFVLAGGVWVTIKEPRVKETIMRIVKEASRRPQSKPREAAHPDKSLSEHRQTPSPLPDHELQPSPVMLTIALSSDMTLENGLAPSFTLPAGDRDLVRFQLIVKSKQSESFRAELLTIAGQSIFSAGGLTPIEAEQKINFDVLARLLSAGDYQVRLSRADSKEVAKYFFRVR